MAYVAACPVVVHNGSLGVPHTVLIGLINFMARDFRFSLVGLMQLRQMLAMVLAFCSIGYQLELCAQTPTDSEVASEPSAAKNDDRFQLNELRVLGNTVLPALSIEKILLSYLGPERSLKDVEAARAALETHYHDQGYGTVYVDIPEQTVDTDGVVRLHVTEAYLRRASISGARYFSQRQIRAAIPAASEHVVPNLPALQSQITAVNSVTSDRIVTPVLKAGALPGTVDLGLKVEDTLPFHGAVELNNQYTADTSPLRASLALSYANAFDRQDSASFQYQTAPSQPDEVRVLAFAYNARLTSSGDQLTVSYIDSSSSVATVGDIVVAGKGKIYSVRYTNPLTVSPQSISSLVLGFDYKHSTQDVSVSDVDSLQTPLDYSSIQAAYNLSMHSDERIWSWSPSVVFGVPALSSSPQKFDDKCFGCRANFFVLKMDASVRQNLWWHLSAALQMSGQYSVDPVISNEQLLIGGAHTVRGYLEAEELGDMGVRGSFELRASKLMSASAVIRAEPYLFYDAGYVKLQRPLQSQIGAAELQSTGFGVDLVAWKLFTGTLIYADPLISSGHTLRGHPRWQFIVRGAW